MGRSGSERVADALRAEEARLDDLSRARMEKRLLEAHHAAPVEARAAAQPYGRWIFAGGLAAAAAVALFVWTSGDEGVTSGHPAGATFQAYEDGETVRRGAFAEGEIVRTAEGHRVEVRLPDTRVDVTPSTVARFVHFDAESVQVSVSSGAIEVEFHPQRRGEQSLTVTTPAARVEVVGTIFRVEVDGGSTTVRVEEGVVRVVPTAGGPPRMVRAGEATRVALEATAETEIPEAEASEAVASVAPASAPGRAASTPVLDTPIEEATVPDEPELEAEVADVEAETELQEISIDARFDLADVYFARGRMAQARHVLHQIIRSPVQRTHRTRAWTSIAESYGREGDWQQAAEAYRRASESGRGTVHGRNALYAYAVVLDRRLGDGSGARAAYRRYIDQAAQAQLRGAGPSPHLHLCRQRLCQLGERAYCTER